MCRKVLCYGDSNTFGYDPRSALGGRYPETVRWTARLEQRGWIVLNEGQNGRTIPRREWEIEALGQAIARWNPDVVAIMLGSNDLLQDPNLSASECALRMERFLGALLERDRGRRYLLISPPPMRVGAWTGDGAVVRTSQQLGAHYEAASRRLGIGFADAGEWNVVLAFDGVHFSEAGHLAFAGEMDAVLSGSKCVATS